LKHRWIRDTVAAETTALEGIRRAFVREPTADALHRVRTGARRLRSLLEDVAAIAPHKRLRRRAKRAAELTGEARDAAVQRELLERLLDDGERADAQPLLTSLREREAHATAAARRQLRRIHFTARRGR
jgi:CHAD domain-containing protein